MGRKPRIRFQSLFSAALLLAVFISFNRRALQVPFALDEPMNLYSVWSIPLWKLAASHLAFWDRVNRPLQAIYYLPLFHVFGWNPLPFNIVRLSSLLVNLAIFFALAKILTRSLWTATLASLPIAYHSGTALLAYNGSFIQDVLCGGFFFGTLLFYIAQRKHGRLGPWQSALFLALYVAALDSKEMAVSLPVIVLAYELLFFRKEQRQMLPVLIAGAITAVFIFSKTGPGTLTDIEVYRPVFTWARFSDSSTRFVNTVFDTHVFTMRNVLILWLILFYAGVRRWGQFRWDPRWLFLWVWVVVTPLPLAFLPGRGGPMLYIVLGGWAMIAALFLRAVVRRLAHEPLFAWMPNRIFMAAVLLALAAEYAQKSSRANWAFANYIAGELRIQHLIADLKTLPFRPAHRSRIIFLNDPISPGYATTFTAFLEWKDPSLNISLQNMDHLSPDQIAAMDYIFDFEDGHLKVLKP